jgi:NAD-reducing hydrogenase large subunit
MSASIVIEPVTRIEGHAKISIQLDESGQVQSAKLNVTELRGFEKFCQGRPFHEMPGLMSRVCGICPVSHAVASSKTGDMLLGVEIPVAAAKQRELMNYAQVLQSHALSFFHLSSPDLLLGMDAPPAKRNIFGLLETDRDFLRRGIRLRQFGQEVIGAVGGKRIHPGWSGPGGVHRRFTPAHRDAIEGWIPEALKSTRIALDRLKRLLDSFQPEIEHMGNFPSLFLGTVNAEGGLEYYDGVLRIADGAGNTIVPQLDPKTYFTYLGEASEDSSYMKMSYYRPMGYPQGWYRVGPLARLNVAKFAGTAEADRELREFKQRGKGAVCQSFHYHLARLIEILHCTVRIQEMLEDKDLLGADIQAKASLNRQEGVGSCEAPRGTLFHRYSVDENGVMTAADLLIATSQNHQAMNRALEQTARAFWKPLSPGDGPGEGFLNRMEAAIRCFDPCLSCSTHALGQMPLIVEIFDSAGEKIGTLSRGA